MKLKNLPIGTSTFNNLVKKGYIYIDKTEFLYKLVTQENGRFFISRPRRFGKSLTCSTLATIFEGDKKNFNGLWIEKSDYQWKKVPVIHIDFNGIRHKTAEDFEDQLTQRLYANAHERDIKLPTNLIAEQALAKMIIELNKAHGPVAVIIDEYDKPIIDHIDNLAEADKIRTVLKSFYGTFKNNEVDARLRFLFVTGVSKFSKVSLFSDVNNLADITNSPTFDAIVGYTKEEVESNLHNHIQALANHKKMNYKEIFEQLKLWYNGFRFSPETSTTVYNPVSLHSCLTERVFSNYWFNTGTPNFLLKILKKEPAAAKAFFDEQKHEISASAQNSFEPTIYYRLPNILFLQTGYLTIKKSLAQGRKLELDYPNFEIRSSMMEQIFEYVAQISPVNFIDYVEHFRNALLVDDIDAFCKHFSDFLKLIPHNLIVDREKFYQSTFHNVALLIGAEVIGEVATSQGFIDIVIHGKKNVYVIEFKKDRSPDAALKQISDKKYFEQFKIKGKKPVVLVGINFMKFRNTVRVSWKTAVC